MREEIINKLIHSSVRAKVAVGFDGYVDSILRVKKNGDGYFSTLAEFGQYIESKAQKSCSVELHRVTEKMGGNMPIFSQALAGLGADVTCIGAMGYPELLPIFTQLGKRCALKTVSNPGYCQALEFDDGKLMLASNEEIEHLDYETLVNRAGKEYLLRTFQENDMLVLLNWSEMKGSLSLWNGLYRDIFTGLSGKQVFIDLSDCSGRTESDIGEAVGLIRRFSELFEVSVSFNRNEAERIAEATGIAYDSVEDLAAQLYHLLECRRLIIHLVDSSYCVYDGRVYMQSNRHIAHPVLSTGGGDNYNAGFVYGLLNGLDADGCIFLANSVSGFYVSHGYSPEPQELAEWIKS